MVSLPFPRDETTLGTVMAPALAALQWETQDASGGSGALMVHQQPLASVMVQAASRGSTGRRSRVSLGSSTISISGLRGQRCPYACRGGACADLGVGGAQRSDGPDRLVAVETAKGHVRVGR